MATVIIRPNSDVSQTNLTKSSGTNPFYSYVDEETLDTGDYLKGIKDNTSIVKFGYTSTGLSNVTINSILMYVDLGYSPVSPKYISANNNEVTASWTSGVFTCTLTTNPDTSSAWTLNDIDTIVGGIKFGSGSKNDSLIYRLYISVDYTAAGGDPSSIINHVMHYRRLMSR